MPMAANQSVLITGCSDDGIGSALAIVFQRKGYHVFATARNPAKMSKLKDLSNVTFLTLNVTDPDHITDAVAAVTQQTGGTLDYLINNAGTNHYMPILDENIDEAKRIYENNVWGPLRLTQAFAPLVINAQGTIVFITSLGGHITTPFVGVYSASKRSLEMLADNLRLEMTPFKVKVLSVVTGTVQSMGASYFDDWKLPENSLYKCIEPTIIKRTRWEDGLQRMDLMDYATKVVDAITRGRTGKVWYGHFVNTILILTRWLPSWIWESGMIRDSGLGDMARQKQE